MPKVTYTAFEGPERTIEGRAGESVMEIAVRNGLQGIVGECGGSLNCSTCHVYVDEGDFEALDAMEEMEDEMLDEAASERKATSRLSCQIRVTEDCALRVTTPRTQY